MNDRMTLRELIALLATIHEDHLDKVVFAAGANRQGGRLWEIQVGADFVLMCGYGPKVKS